MKVIKTIGIVFGTILGVVIIALLSLNLLKFAIYSEYYHAEDSLCVNPGLSDGFIQQGVAVVDGTDYTIVSGYMKDKTKNSRIYVVASNGVSHYVNLVKNNETFTGHCGGVATSHDKVYLANNSKIYTIDLNDVINAKKGDTVEIGEGIKVNNSASFVYTNDTYLYVGEFNYSTKYVCEHLYQTNEGLHKAIVTKYALTDLTTPLQIFSIRDKVQGMAFTNGYVVMSTSWGVNDSIYYIYEEASATPSDNYLDGCQVYYLDNCLKSFKGPAMSEDLDVYRDGVIVTTTESASDKYIFGKFFFANRVVTIDINKILEK